MNQKPNDMKETGATKQSSSAAADAPALALKDMVKDDAKDLGHEVKHIAEDLAGQAKKSAQAELAVRKDQAAGRLDDVAGALRHTGDHLRQQNKNELTEYIDRAAEQVEAASGYLQRKTLGELVEDVEDFARREPALFIGGAFVLGLVGGRFLKATSPSNGAASPTNGAR